MNINFNLKTVPGLKCAILSPHHIQCESYSFCIGLRVYPISWNDLNTVLNLKRIREILKVIPETFR